MKTIRTGLGTDGGKGYKNILHTDSNVHAQSAKGVKTAYLNKMVSQSKFADEPSKFDNPKMNETEKVLNDMLKENTGINMLDSGGESGRHWQRNKFVDFTKQPEIIYDESGYTKNIFPFLNKFLTFDSSAKKYQDIYDKKFGKSKESDMKDMEDFGDYLKQKGISKSDDYLVSDKKMSITNTYNDDSVLSQDLQYGMFYDGKEYFVVLQIHNGADIRGGYTKPKIFAVDGEQFILKQKDAYVKTKDDKSYYTDDTYHFYNDEEGSNKTYTWEDLYKKGIKSVY
jgi:hypothetical protein